MLGLNSSAEGSKLKNILLRQKGKDVRSLMAEIACRLSVIKNLLLRRPLRSIIVRGMATDGSVVRF